MSRRNALAEDLRRFGLVLLTAGVVGGYLQDSVASGSAIYAMFAGIALCFVGYILQNPEVRK